MLQLLDLWFDKHQSDILDNLGKEIQVRPLELFKHYCKSKFYGILKENNIKPSYQNIHEYLTITPNESFSKKDLDTIKEKLKLLINNI